MLALVLRFRNKIIVLHVSYSNTLNLDSMPSQPLFPYLEIRHCALKPPPELGCVVGFVEVDEFMDDDVFSDLSPK